jgi:cyclophilin family peptidyl-prolyl cis-trans isomerase
MPNRKTRDRHLAKLASRRAMERRKKRRQRILAGSVGAAIAVAGIGVGLAFMLRGTPKAAAAKPRPTASSTPSATSVACGGSKPASASVTKPQFQKAPPLTISPKKTYKVTMNTSCGTIQLLLDPKDAPIAVNSFVFLVRKHFYDGLTFHRVVKDFVIQGGDPTGSGSGGPGYKFKDEVKNKLKYDIGVLAMANSGPNTNGSQFFIVAGTQAKSLPKQYTIFGLVSKGLDVVKLIDSLPTNSQTQKPLATVYIVSMTLKIS